ncbi:MULTISPECIES: glycosyltransferase [Methylomonas]|uniref:glycosyltransferase n=1 Tax=Methylomonas TaxID=416 RepID=UPI0012328745|nr:glycosyltransferase [Methylomonas rhizoryzae]
MIFVTVGTTLPFDDLIRLVDEAVGCGAIQDKVICQIGHGAYQPRHCEFFHYSQSLSDYLDQADRVICHGGTGSTLDVVARGKKFVAVANPKGADDHQTQFLARLAKVVPILWTRELSEVLPLLARAENYRYQTAEVPSLADDLNGYIAQLGSEAV